METVQLQCGNCGKVMAISTEHLGGQVRCPHCLSVVQTPPRQESASVPTEDASPHAEAGEVESIFAPPEPSDDLFGGGPQKPFVEMPLDVTPAPPAVDHAPIPAQARPQQDVNLFAGAPPAFDQQPSDESHASDFAAMRRPRPVYDRSYLSLMAFIFLVPYAVLSTVIVVYLMYQLATVRNDLRTLPDPVNKDKAKEVNRPKHDQPLAEDQKVPINGTITVGETEVKPVRVEFDEELSELRLVLRVKNVSTNQMFSPMHPDFLKIGKGPNPPKPYTFLESAKFSKIYETHMAFKRIGAADLSSDGNLRPGEDEELFLMTRGNKELLHNIVASSEDLLWRVQLRRGLVDYGGQRVSATTVIGVQFNAKDIKKDQPEPART